MRLFEETMTTHQTPGAFWGALDSVIGALNAEAQPKAAGIPQLLRAPDPDMKLRTIARSFSVPIGGDKLVDPICNAVYVGRHNATDAVKVLVAFQRAWEHYQDICKAEGRMAA